MKPTEDILTIDPVAMNVINRVAAGSNFSGQLTFEGGVLVQGEISGNIEVRGRLIVWAGGLVHGNIHVWGDLYLFGQIGQAQALAADTVVTCMGTAFVAHTGVSTGMLTAQRLRLYEGADLQGPFRTLKPGEGLPVLTEHNL